MRQHSTAATGTAVTHRPLQALVALAVAVLAVGTSVAWAAEDPPTHQGDIGVGELVSATDVDLDWTGTVYVADYNARTVEVFGPTGVPQGTIGGPGTGDGQLSFPAGIEVFHDRAVGRQRLLVSEFGGDRLSVFETDGTFVEHVAALSGATPEALSFPLGVAEAPDGRLAVADYENERVLVLTNARALAVEIDLTAKPRGVAFSADGSTLYVYTAIEDLESYDAATGAPLGSVDVSGLFSSSGTHLHSDDVGYLYLTGTSARTVVKLSPSGEAQWTLDAFGLFTGPQAARPTPAGQLLVADGGRVQLWDLCTTDFADVAPGHPFFTEICWMATSGVSTGYDDGTYKPTAAVSRLAMSAFLYRFAEEPAFVPPVTPTFSDVPAGNAFFAEIEWMADAGISNGYSDGTYRPADPVSRQAMAAFMYRAAGEPAFVPPLTPSFADVPTTHQFFAEIEWMAASGISTGYSDGTFRPSTAVSRQAMSAFLSRLGLLG